jgi:hypothetical protein
MPRDGDPVDPSDCRSQERGSPTLLVEDVLHVSTRDR